MMRHAHGYIVHLAFVSFVVMIFLNFYINVWQEAAVDTFYIDSVSTLDQHRNSSFAWHRWQWNRNVQEIPPRNVNNVTFRNAIPHPGVTVSNLHVTPPYSDQPIIWPDLKHLEDDRIITQLSYVPRGREQSRKSFKKILLIDGLQHWDVKSGPASFIHHECPVSTCTLTENPKESSSADAILFRHNPRFPWFKRPLHQIWILYMLESPYFTPRLSNFANMFNWTATYRHDSDIVTPYEKFVKFQPLSRNNQRSLGRNYAAGKTKKVAWFVSNCRASNQRLEYARELSRYIDVDIYGKCGPKKCKRGNKNCNDMLDKDYKFYLSFENSNCRDYITEKFFVTGLQHDVIPIVMGAAPEDYQRAAPHNSHIHVDHYDNPKALAKYLHELDNNDDLYNEYFQWKGSGSFINTKFWCRLCSMLHDKSRGPTYYDNLEEWWRGRNVCIGKGRWRQHPRTEPYISGYHAKPR